MRQMLLIGILSFLLFSSGIPAETSEWKLEQNEHSTSVKSMGTAEINDLRADAVLKCDCSKNGAFLRLEIADFDKVQKHFNLRIFEGPSAPTLDMALTTIELQGVNPVQSISFKQNGYISVDGRFVIEISQVQANSIALAQLYRRMATEGNLLRIRIKSYRDPKQFIISEFPLNNSRKAIAALVAACPNSKPQPRKPAMGK